MMKWNYSAQAHPFRNNVLEFDNWYPGIESTKRFMPEREIPKIHVYVLIIIAALGVGFPYLLFFEPEPSPAWIIADISGSQTSPGTFIKIAEEDLVEYFKLAAAIEQADAAEVRPGVLVEPHGQWIKMTHDEGREIVAFLGGEYKTTVKTYFLKVWLNGNVYRIHIEFEEAPKRA